MSLAIEINNLSKSFDDNQALKDISFQVEEGSIFGFLGPNGAGKTTTIKILMGLMKADRGTVRVLGMDCEKETFKINQQLAYVAEVDQLYDYMKVREIIEFTKGFYRNWNQNLLEKYLDFFNLPLDKKIKNLSKGMKKQLSLVLALAVEPKLLILDEPTSGLDPVNKQEILRIILEEISTQGRTVFFSSHLLSDIERIADTVAIINKGKIIDLRSVDDIKENVKKVRVVFQKEPDENVLRQAGIESYKQQGNAYIFTIDDNFQEVLKNLKQHPHFTLDIIERNLEEIFIDKVKGDVNA
ncbi:ABC transporter ATP-binding protein [Natronospora cellulosivora (SeqCode)]